MKNYLLLLSVMVIALANTSCEKSYSHEAESTTYEVTSPLVKDTTVTNEYVCQIRSIQHIELRALEKGYINKINVDEGSSVREGQVMFQILPLVYEAEYKKALAEAKLAEIEYENTKALTHQNIVSANELSMMRAKYEKAVAAAELAKTHLGFTVVKAPFNGIMNRLHVQLGSLVNEGDLLTTVSDNSQMWVYFNVPEAEYLNYKMDSENAAPNTATLVLANHKVYEHKGNIKTIMAEFNNETGNIAFRATFPNPDAILRHGETGKVILKKHIHGAVLIPQKATFEILDKKMVYLITADNKAVAKEIKVNSELEDMYIVESGLKPTDKILLEGHRIITENEPIHYEYKSPELALATLKLHAE